MKPLARQQRGLAMVEFAIVGAVFFMVLFGVIEVGRLLYTWNVLDEVTRRGARLATVCPVTDLDAIRQRATFQGQLISGLAPEHLLVEYLRADGSAIADPAADFPDIAAVRTRISGYTHAFIVPFLYNVLTPPPFTVTALSESLGVSPVGTGTTTCGLPAA